MATASKKPKSKIRKRGGEYHVTSINGKFLGWTANKHIAERMAESNMPLITAMGRGCELGLWLAWNDAVKHAKATVIALLDDFPANPKQALMLTDEIFMVACDESGGWSVDLLGIDDFMDQYADSDGVIQGFISSEPFNLE